MLQHLAPLQASLFCAANHLPAGPQMQGGLGQRLSNDPAWRTSTVMEMQRMSDNMRPPTPKLACLPAQPHAPIHQQATLPTHLAQRVLYI